MQKPFYKPGAFTIFGLIKTMLFTLPLATLAAAIYALCIWFVPFIYFNALIALIFSGGLYGIISTGVFLGKIRDRFITMLLFIIVAIWAFYFHWAVWLSLLTHAGKTYSLSHLGITLTSLDINLIFALAAKPWILWDTIKEINMQGVWSTSRSGELTKGLMLWLVWLGEMATILYISVHHAFTDQGTPFCEQCNSWVQNKTIKFKPLAFIENTEENKELLEIKKFSSIFTNKKEGDLVDYSTIEISQCNCEQCIFLSLDSTKHGLNSKGKIEKENINIMRYLELTRDDLKSLSQYAE